VFVPWHGNRKRKCQTMKGKALMCRATSSAYFRAGKIDVKVIEQCHIVIVDSTNAGSRC